MISAKKIKNFFAGNYRVFYARYLPEVKMNGGSQGMARCLFHEDKKASFSFNNETGLFNCFGCGETGNAFQFFAKLKGLQDRRDFPKVLCSIAEDFGIRISDEKPKLVKVYDYRDAQGNLLFQKCRYEPKNFRLRRPDGKSGWIWNMKGIETIPYRLPEVMKAHEVLVLEGEKDCDTAAGLRMCGTTNPGGAGKWRPEYSEYLRGKDVILIPDNDKPGREHMAQVAAAIQDVVVSLKWIELPHLPEKGDLTDWADRIGDCEEATMQLAEMIDRADQYVPPQNNTDQDRITDGPNTEFPPTDMGNAERLVDRHGQEILYCYPWKKWLIWDGRLWVLDDSGEIERRAKQTVRSITKEVTDEMDEEKVKKIYKHAGRSEADARIRAMINLTHSEVPILPHDFDSNQYLLNVENGTIDLKEGKLLQHDRAQFLTKIAPVKYDSSAQCLRWSQFLDRIMDGNTSLIEYLQRIIGYALTGDTSEQSFFIFYGTGANGKSTFIETIRSILGGYAMQADFETFLNSKNGKGIPNDVACLQGARFVSAIEAGAGRSLNESLIKQLTGGEPIRARFLYSEFFEFLPTLKLFLATNHKPRILNQDWGIWRRVRLIPFNVTIPKEEQDSKLVEKLKEESSGILNWAIEGCREWLISGLGEPEEVATATNLYREEMDSIGAFLEEQCVLQSTASVKTSDLKMAYQDWCDKNKEDPVGPKIFASLLESRGCKAGKSNGARIWKGLELKTGTSGTLDM